MVLGGLSLTSISSELSPTLPFQPSSFPKELQYARYLYFVPLCSHFYFPLKPCGQKLLRHQQEEGRQQKFTPCYVWERTAFPQVMCTTTAIGRGIKFSLLQQKLSVLHLSHKKKKKSLIWSFLLEAGRIPPRLLHPPCLCQVPKSITLTTLCITVIAWVSLALFVTITKADSHRLAWSSLFQTIISEGYLL